VRPDPTYGYRLRSGGDGDVAVVVAMIAMWVMQVPLDEIVGVITVRHLLMTAIWSVLMAAGVRAAIMLGRTGRGVLSVNLDRVLVDVILVGMMEMTVVQIVDMTVVLDRGVAAIRAVSMIVAGVGGMLRSAHTGTLRQQLGNSKALGIRSIPTRARPGRSIASWRSGLANP